MPVNLIMRIIFAYIKGLVSLLVIAFVFSILFKGIGFFVVQYVEMGSVVFSRLILIATLITIAISFYYSAHIIGRDISINAGFVLPSIFAGIILISLVIKHLKLEEGDALLNNWLYLVLSVLFSFIFSYLGANSGRKRVKETGSNLDL